MATDCPQTDLPPAGVIEAELLKAKYRLERDKRLRSDGQAQYVPSAALDSSQFAADPHQPVTPRAAIAEDVDVLVLGAGFAGLLAGYHLTKNGVTDFRLVDQAGDFGGVWYWNRYPGAQCDNDSYCYLPLLEETGFMPSRKFADGAEIQGYCRQIAEHFGFADRALFHTTVQSLRWDGVAQRWLVGTDRGDTVRARFIIMGCGVLNMPKLPAIEGLDRFGGKLFHTARWDYDYTGGSSDVPVLDRLADKRVAIVGTGATAIQAVPHLARHAQHLYVVQRTPSTVDERPNPVTDPAWFLAQPEGWQAERQANFNRAAMEGFLPGEADLICDIWTEIARTMASELAADGWPALSIDQFIARRELVDHRVMERLRSRVETMVADPATAEALKPWYRFLCKRPLSSNDYYPAFNQPNVTLVDVADTQGLQQLTEAGFIAGGREYAADCIIFASGFEVTSDLERRWGIPVVEGRQGRSIYDHWRNGPTTLHGVMTNGFPNMFTIGYIQGGLNASVTEQFGQQARHIAHIVAETLRRGAVVAEPTAQAVADYVAHFEAVAVDTSDFQRDCTPSYFTNEGQVKAPWALFRGYGPGWGAFQDMLEGWRQAGDMAGIALTPASPEG